MKTTELLQVNDRCFYFQNNMLTEYIYVDKDDKYNFTLINPDYSVLQLTENEVNNSIYIIRLEDNWPDNIKNLYTNKLINDIQGKSKKLQNKYKFIQKNFNELDNIATIKTDINQLNDNITTCLAQFDELLTSI